MPGTSYYIPEDHPTDTGGEISTQNQFRELTTTTLQPGKSGPADKLTGVPGSGASGGFLPITGGDIALLLFLGTGIFALGKALTRFTLRG